MISLYVRLSLTLLLIMIAVGSGFYRPEDWSTRRFHEEVTQRLNGSIVLYVTDQTLLIEDGVVNRSELIRLAERARVANPSGEMGLLDVQGAILGHAFAPESVILTEVDPGPAGERPPAPGADRQRIARSAHATHDP